MTWKIALLPFLFALLFWASFHPLNLGFLGYVALVPLLVYSQRASGKRAFFVAWLGGAVAFASAFYWVRYTVPAGPYFLGIYKGLYVAVFTVAVRRLGVVWAPAVWVALEYVRGYLFTGLPWFLIGYTQHDALNLIQIADLGGVWLVSLLVAFVNAALVDPRRPVRIAAAGALVFAYLYGAVRLGTIETAEGPKVAVVQPNIPQDLKLITLEKPQQALDNYRKHLDLSLEAAREKPDLIVWPEASIYRGLYWSLGGAGGWRDTSWKRRLTAPARETGIPHLIGILVMEERDNDIESFTNSGVFVDGEGEITGRFNKVHRVPFAEFVPFADTIPFVRELVRKYSGLRLEDMRPGEEFPIWEAGKGRFGPQICFEAIFPEISREIARNGGSFTVNISNDGWFRASGELDQMQAMARFRSIENRMTVIRATNTGISSFIEPTGRVQAILEKDGRQKEVEGVLVARVRTTGSTSLYRAWGNWAAWAAVVAVVGAAGRIFVDRFRGRA